MNSDARAVVRKLEATVLSTLDPVADKFFENETVEIDGKRFTSCVFKGCVVRYSGGDVEFGPGCEIENSRPEFSGSARRPRLVLGCNGLMSLEPLEAKIKKPPKHT
jgi:hypothetical protein